MSTGRILHGQCLCGAVRFHGTPVPGRGIGVCHCGQCRRWASGPYQAMRFEGGVVMDADDTLTWYASSGYGERGFCARCGSCLFWRAPGDGANLAVNVSTLPEDHGLTIHEHIWIDDKPDFYDYADDAPRRTAAEVIGDLSEDGA